VVILKMMDELACVKVRETEASEAEVVNEEVISIDEVMRIENRF